MSLREVLTCTCGAARVPKTIGAAVARWDCGTERRGGRTIESAECERRKRGAGVSEAERCPKCGAEGHFSKASVPDRGEMTPRDKTYWDCRSVRYEPEGAFFQSIRCAQNVADALRAQLAEVTAERDRVCEGWADTKTMCSHWHALAKYLEAQRDALAAALRESANAHQGIVHTLLAFADNGDLDCLHVDARLPSEPCDCAHCSQRREIRAIVNEAERFAVDGRTALAQQPRTDRAERERAVWRPFDSAPPYQDILAYRPDAGVMAVRYDSPSRGIDPEEDEDCECWWTIEGEDLTGDLPTHWMPMPAGPDADEEGAE